MVSLLPFGGFVGYTVLGLLPDTMMMMIYYFFLLLLLLFLL